MSDYGSIFFPVGRNVLDVVGQLIADHPTLDVFFCSRADWDASEMKGDSCLVHVPTGRGELMPDIYCPRGFLAGIKRPLKVAVDVGATLS